MNSSNKYGFTLESGGAIGKQGNLRSTPSAADGRTCNNSWGAPVSYWQSLGHSMSNLISSSAINSQLIVNGNIWMNPNGSGNTNSTTFFPPYQTNTSNTASIVIGFDDLTSNRCTWTNPVKMLGRYGNTEEVDKLDLEIADGSIDIPLEDADQRLYVLKEQLYEKLKTEETLVSQYPELQDFVQTYSWGSFDFIYYTAQYLAEKDYNSVDLLLSYFPSDNIVDDNYWQYYKWINEMQKNPDYTPPVEEVFAMANLCPATNGRVVFAAQSLYMQLVQDVYNFENTCDNKPAERLINKNKSNRIVNNNNLDNEIKVYPNPSNGLVNIQLPIFNNGNFAITITDLLGKTVAQKNIPSSTYNVQFNITNGKGIYFVKILDTKTGIQKINKLIVQ